MEEEEEMSHFSGWLLAGNVPQQEWGDSAFLEPSCDGVQGMAVGMGGEHFCSTLTDEEDFLVNDFLAGNSNNFQLQQRQRQQQQQQQEWNLCGTMLRERDSYGCCWVPPSFHLPVEQKPLKASMVGWPENRDLIVQCSPVTRRPQDANAPSEHHSFHRSLSFSSLDLGESQSLEPTAVAAPTPMILPPQSASSSSTQPQVPPPQHFHPPRGMCQPPSPCLVDMQQPGRMPLPLDAQFPGCRGAPAPASLSSGVEKNLPWPPTRRSSSGSSSSLCASSPMMCPCSGEEFRALHSKPPRTEWGWLFASAGSSIPPEPEESFFPWRCTPADEGVVAVGQVQVRAESLLEVDRTNEGLFQAGSRQCCTQELGHRREMESEEGCLCVAGSSEEEEEEEEEEQEEEEEKEEEEEEEEEKKTGGEKGGRLGKMVAGESCSPSGRRSVRGKQCPRPFHGADLADHFPAPSSHWQVHSALGKGTANQVQVRFKPAKTTRDQYSSAIPSVLFSFPYTYDVQVSVHHSGVSTLTPSSKVKVTLGLVTGAAPPTSGSPPSLVGLSLPAALLEQHQHSEELLAGQTSFQLHPSEGLCDRHSTLSGSSRFKFQTNSYHHGGAHFCLTICISSVQDTYADSEAKDLFLVVSPPFLLYAKKRQGHMRVEQPRKATWDSLHSPTRSSSCGRSRKHKPGLRRKRSGSSFEDDDADGEYFPNKRAHHSNRRY